jgi:molybdopterin converting factor subunit 1
MALNIKLFATLKDRVGQRSVSIPLDDATQVETLLARIAAAYPMLADALPSCVVAVNRQFANPDTVVKAGDEVALFPPVSGG